MFLNVLNRYGFKCTLKTDIYENILSVMNYFSLLELLNFSVKVLSGLQLRVFRRKLSYYFFG